ncbi:MAG: DUF2785 domain-containing protein [Pseudomonadales bacterium]|nr:DUF2785 domain-containing protein [Pseudomonadales bacterium]
MQTESALSYWRPIRESITEAEHDANQLATALVSCLGSPNSELRDRIGYELFTYWLRNEQLSQQTKIDLFQQLASNIDQESTANSLLRSFSALILSELLRADNLSTFMSDSERLKLLQQSVLALSNESDYRGLVEDIGWVHPVAHLADVLWRFALHSSLNQQQARLVLEGVRRKAGVTTASYGFNEGDRLARPVSVLIVREILPALAIIEWLNSFNSPAVMDNWYDAFASIEGMNELHNTKLFIRALSDQLQDESINSEIRAMLDELVAVFTAIV